MLIFQGIRSLVDNLALSPDGRFLLSDHQLWNLASPGEPAVELKLPPVADRVGGGFLDDGRLAFVTKGGIVLLANPAKPTLILSQGGVLSKAVSASVVPGNQLLVTDHDSFGLWRLDGNSVKPVFCSIAGERTFPQFAKLSLDASRLVIGVAPRQHSHSTMIREYDLGGQFIRELFAEVEALHELELSPCGRFMAGVSHLRLCVWDVDSGLQLADLKAAGTRLFRGPQFHPSGQFLAAGGANVDGGVFCWDTSTWSEIVGYRWPVGPVMRVIFSADGTLAAAGGEKGQVTVWDVDL